MSLGLGPGKSWKVVENKPNGCHISDPCTFSAFTCIIIVHCHTRFDLLFSIIMNCITYSMLYENLTCLISTQNGNGHKWSWKVMENAHKKVLESHGKPLSVFCMHSELIECLEQWCEALKALMEEECLQLLMECQ